MSDDDSGIMAGAAGMSDLQFWGIEVPPGKEGVSVDVEQNEDYMELIHLTNVALGIKAKKDQRVTLFMELPEGQRHVLGSLELGRCEQFTLETVQGGLFKLVHNGDHPISVTGYKHTTVNDFSDLEEDEDEDEDEEEEQEEEDDGAVPQGVPIQMMPKNKLKAFAAAAADEDDDDEDDDDSDDGMDGQLSPGDDVMEIQYDSDEADRELKFDRMAQGAGGEGEDDSDEDDDDDEGSDDDDMMGEGSDDEDDDEDDSDDDDDEEEEELPKGKGKGASMTPAAGDKRKGAPASTPAPATGGKKARVEETPKGAAAPATGKKEKGEVPKTPKTPAAGAGQGTDALKKQWEEAIVQVLKQKGPQTPGALGGAAKKPEGLNMKLKSLVGESKRIKMDGDKVALK